MVASHARAADLMRRERSGAGAGDPGAAASGAGAADGAALRKVLAARKQQHAAHTAQSVGAGAALAVAMLSAQPPHAHAAAVAGSCRVRAGTGASATAAISVAAAAGGAASSSAALGLPPGLAALIGAKSKHAAGAQQEAAEGCAATLRWLDTKDGLAAERDKVTEEKCRAYTCQTVIGRIPTLPFSFSIIPFCDLNPCANST